MRAAVYDLDHVFGEFSSPGVMLRRSVLKIAVRSRDFSRLRPLERLKPLLQTIFIGRGAARGMKN